MKREEIGKIKDPFKKFLAFLSYAGIESDRILIFSNRPAVAVPKTATIRNPDLSVETETFIDDGREIELLVISPSPELKGEWERLWREYKEENMSKGGKHEN